MAQFANMPKIFFGRKSLNVTTVKLLSNYFFNVLWVFVMPFCFQASIKGEKVLICYLFTFYCMKQPLKLKIFPNSLRNKKFLQNGP